MKNSHALCKTTGDGPGLTALAAQNAGRCMPFE
jgi:hypothetical protein